MVRYRPLPVGSCTIRFDCCEDKPSRPCDSTGPLICRCSVMVPDEVAGRGAHLLYTYWLKAAPSSVLFDTTGVRHFVMDGGIVSHSADMHFSYLSVSKCIIVSRTWQIARPRMHQDAFTSIHGYDSLGMHALCDLYCLGDRILQRHDVAPGSGFKC